jgi:hypothetical protein
MSLLHDLAGKAVPAFFISEYNCIIKFSRDGMNPWRKLQLPARDAVSL